VPQVAAHHRVQHLAHRQHYPPQQHQGLAQLERAPLYVQVLGRCRREQVVL